MEHNLSPKNTSSQETFPQDALHETVNLIVSGYLKNNLDKNNNPSSSHFTLGLKKSIESGIQIKNPNSRDAKVNAFLKYLNRDERIADMDEDELSKQDLTTSPLRTLIHEIAEDFAIDISDTKKLDHLAEAVFQSEIDILIKRGQGGDIEGVTSWEKLDESQKEKYRDNVKQKRNEQVRSIERWIKYVSSDEAEYPSWYKYFIITSLRSMGVEQFELGTYTYGGRDHKTLFRFPTLNPAVLAKVYDRMLSAYTEENRKKPTPTKYDIQDTVRSNIDDAENLFLEKYAKEANLTQLYAYELSKYKERTVEGKRSSEGVWIKYDQQKQGTKELKEEAIKLSSSLQDKGTMWCTEGTSFSESQLVGGDFYVYYTREDFDKETHNISLEDMTEEEKRKVCTMPRIAIKMYNGKIHELRGIVGGNEQDLEPEMLDIARAKYQGDKEKGEEPLGGYEAYEKKARDMKYLLSVIEKQDKSTVLTRDDLLFLYEVHGKIEGFGHNEDPRIEDIKSKRNKKEDIQTLCNCDPQYIATDFININESTQVYCEDTGKKITFFDFREEQNQKKIPQLIELAKNIKESGSPTRPDMSFEGGIVDVEIEREKLKDLSTALTAYEDADDHSPSWIWEEWRKMKTYEAPQQQQFEAVILSYNADEATRQSSDAIVADMERMGLRPATIAELIALGITHPECNKQKDVYLVGLGTKESLGGFLHVPLLVFADGERFLNRDWWSDGWGGFFRFVCVRK